MFLLSFKSLYKSIRPVIMLIQFEQYISALVDQIHEVTYCWADNMSCAGDWNHAYQLCIYFNYTCLTYGIM